MRRDVGGVRGVIFLGGMSMGQVGRGNPSTIDHLHRLRPIVGVIGFSTYLTNHMPI